jgi:hypothetical protein
MSHTSAALPGMPGDTLLPRSLACQEGRGPGNWEGTAATSPPAPSVVDARKGTPMWDLQSLYVGLPAEEQEVD